MSVTGIVRRIDSLGRLVIPMEIRKYFGFETNQELEVFLDGNGIVIKKHEKSCAICSSDDSLMDISGKLICRSCVEHIGHIQKKGA